MALGEDLLLLAVDPRGGAVRRADRIGFPLRASELVDLALAGRIEVADGRIRVIDPTWMDKRRLDETLSALVKAKRAPTIREWTRDTPRGYAMVREYLVVLKRQGAVRLVQFGNGRSAKTRAVLLDPGRRDAVMARIDRVARGKSADEADLALAALVCSCGLSRYLQLSIKARWRLARTVMSWRNGHSAEDVVEAAKQGGAEALERSSSTKVALLTDEVIDWALRRYRDMKVRSTGRPYVPPAGFGSEFDQSSGQDGVS
jgi:hypothetical protein